MNQSPVSLLTRPIRAAIVGTGYIAEFHARAIRALPNVELVSVCDTNLTKAKAFAAQWGVPSSFHSLQSMLESQRVDVAHVLAPPDLHHPLAKAALQAGSNVLLEKPMTVSTGEAVELLEIANAKKLLVGVNHNFLFSSAYRRMREVIRSDILGPLDYICFNYFCELTPIRVGPFGSWMLQSPKNVLLEVGPHPMSAILDLVELPSALSVTVDRKVRLPNQTEVIRRWRIQMTAGNVALQVNINLGPGFNQRTIAVRGQLGAGIVDLDANTCVIDRDTPFSADLDHYKRSLSVARQIRSQARKTLADYTLTKFKLRQRGNSYEASITDSVAAFYDGLRCSGSLDKRISGEFGREVVELCNKIIGVAQIERFPTKKTLPQKASKSKPTVLVIGGAGFIGRELVRQLLKAGYAVRVMTRSSNAALEELCNERLETMRGDVGNESDLTSAMQGIEFVYDLATSEAKTWEASLQNIVEPTRLLAKACLVANVKRLIYTGTIDSYYAGAAAGVITEQTPLDRNIRRRNYYARAKAAAERLLMDMHDRQKLPLVIVRPGIVIGDGGTAFHWGVGKFSNGVCEVWGDGTNKLPLVLVHDVATALLRCIQTEGIDGHSYNLVDIPLLSAREYLTELQRLAGLKLSVYYRSISRFYLSDMLKWMVKLTVRHPDAARIPSYRDWESRTQRAIFTCNRAREELGWTPASDKQRMINEGIAGSLRSWLAAVY